MPGPIGKDPSVRARRNKATTRATLHTEHDVVAPKLPEGVQWHELTLRWWADIWASPMAPEYVESDINGLFRVAMMHNDFWLASTPKQRAEVQVRLEKADVDYGTNPMARRRLEWQIETTEDSKARGKKRRVGDAPPASTVSEGAADPRLKLVQ